MAPYLAVISVADARMAHAACIKGGNKLVVLIGAHTCTVAHGGQRGVGFAGPSGIRICDCHAAYMKETPPEFSDEQSSIPSLRNADRPWSLPLESD